MVIAEEVEDPGFKHTLFCKDSGLFLLYLRYFKLYNNHEEGCSNPQYHSS